MPDVDQVEEDHGQPPEVEERRPRQEDGPEGAPLAPLAVRIQDPLGQDVYDQVQPRKINGLAPPPGQAELNHITPATRKAAIPISPRFAQV